MLLLTRFLQQIDIEEKIKNAPDKGYEIGVFIGSMLPFVILVLIAYLIYRYNKKNNHGDDVICKRKRIISVTRFNFNNCLRC